MVPSPGLLSHTSVRPRHRDPHSTLQEGSNGRDAREHIHSTRLFSTATSGFEVLFCYCTKRDHHVRQRKQGISRSVLAEVWQEKAQQSAR